MFHRTTKHHGCRFCDIIHQNNNISWLQISWDITPLPQYLMAADFVIYYTRPPITHGWRFHEVLHQNHNISWMQIAWDIITEPECEIFHFFGGIGTGIGKNWYRKKVSEPVSEEFSTGKSIGTGIGKIWYRKKYRNRYWKNLVPELIVVAKI
jgi:hypothetical protein